jgi:hypothetical protein
MIRWQDVAQPRRPPGAALGARRACGRASRMANRLGALPEQPVITQSSQRLKMVRREAARAPASIPRAPAPTWVAQQ